MRNVAILAIGLALLLIQGNLFRFIGPLHIHGATPSLVLPLVIFLGVHEANMARGALLAFGLGYSSDLLASAPIGLFAFTYVAIWWLSRVAAVRLSAQTVPTQMFLALGFSLVESVIVLMLLAIFGVDPQRPLELSSIVVPHALSTALFSPPVFRIAQRLQQGVAPTGRSADGGSQA